MTHLCKSSLHFHGSYCLCFTAEQQAPKYPGAVRVFFFCEGQGEIQTVSCCVAVMVLILQKIKIRLNINCLVTLFFLCKL